MFDVKRLAVELMLVAQPSANLDWSSLNQGSRVTDEETLLGSGKSDEEISERIEEFLTELFKKGQEMVNVCTNRIPVVIRGPKGPKTMKLTFKAARAWRSVRLATHTGIPLGCPKVLAPG